MGNRIYDFSIEYLYFYYVIGLSYYIDFLKTALGRISQSVFLQSEQ